MHTHTHTHTRARAHTTRRLGRVAAACRALAWEMEAAHADTLSFKWRTLTAAHPTAQQWRHVLLTYDHRLEACQRACELHFSDAAPRPPPVRIRFDGSSAYDWMRFRFLEWAAHIAARVNRQIARQPAGALPVVLDVMCGSGYFSVLLKARLPTARVVCSELEPEAAQLARHNVRPFCHVVRVRVARRAPPVHVARRAPPDHAARRAPRVARCHASRCTARAAREQRRARGGPPRRPLRADRRGCARRPGHASKLRLRVPAAVVSCALPHCMMPAP